ncbi:AAA family ATPase [bacterium]|nr:AAA family ATPase [bacterium]
MLSEIKKIGLEKVTALFNFIKELNLLRQKTVTNVAEYHWYFPFSKIHDDPENITLCYHDRENNDEKDFDSTILSVRKPEFENCPDPDPIFRDWLEQGWNDFRQEVEIKDTKPNTNNVVLTRNEENAKDIIEDINFEDNENRVNLFNSWKIKREIWVKRQEVIEQTRALFGELFRYFYELQEKLENGEIIVANGLLTDKNDKDIKHPLLLRKVKMVFDYKKNLISIEDTDADSEFYSTLLNKIKDINISQINELNDELKLNNYHPLDRKHAPVFLKSVLNKISSKTSLSDDNTTEAGNSERFMLSFEPCLILRKKQDGTIRAIDQIIDSMNKDGIIPSSILDIVCGGDLKKAEVSGDIEHHFDLASASGEGENILLSKEANQEQFEIASRIENYNAVLVQGPPGTGKTHTIANLMGHFLAKGNTVLVTSHTKKALRVLKEKVPKGLQHLCVSILDDSNVDMQQSVDEITDFMSHHDIYELEVEMNKLSNRRKKIIDSHEKVRGDIIKIIKQEDQEISINGISYKLSEAARFVSDNENELSYIPGNVNDSCNCLPLESNELSLLYRSNEELSIDDETELNYKIPDPSNIISPKDLEDAYNVINEEETKIKDLLSKKGWSINLENTRVVITDIKSGAFSKIKFSLSDGTAIKDIKEHIDSLNETEEWMKYVAIDGSKTKIHRENWYSLINTINKTCESAEKVLGKLKINKVVLPEKEEEIEQLINEYKTIHSVFASEGRISWLTNLMNPSFETALEKTKINGHKISNFDECDIVFNSLQLKLLRYKCSSLWEDLMAKHGCPSFFMLSSDEPESIAKKFIPYITKYLDWYKEDLLRFVDKLMIFDVIPNIFQRDELESDYSFIGKILNVANTIVTPVCDIYISQENINNKKEKINDSLKILKEDLRINSCICRDAVDSIANQDCRKYKACFEKLSSEFSKYDLLEKRNYLLLKLEKYAPQWASDIRERKGIHGEGKVPDKIYDAWKWKQLAQKIDVLLHQSLSDLLDEHLKLSEQYRKITAQYAEKCGWYHMLVRINGDISVQQNLQGWKKTVMKIGKGTGKTAPRRREEARKLMIKCQNAVPGWIMPINRVLDIFMPGANSFDVVIIDEASQADISSLAILFMGKKLVIVGDDKQVSPMAIGVNEDDIYRLEKQYIKNIIPNSNLYDGKSSIYDIACTTFHPLMLKEHFRCVPDIIGFSNMLSYDYKIKPLRDASDSILLPAVVNYRVPNGCREGDKNVNEARMIVALMKACIEQPEYAGKSMGVITLQGDEQDKLIQQLIERNIDNKEITNRRILSGTPPHFQGDERDVIFISLVDSASENGPLPKRDFGQGEMFRKRYNVAASRAKDQLWVVDSLDSDRDLKPGDIRKTLIDYSKNPKAKELQNAEIEEKSESPFESEVAQILTNRGYNLVQQWKVGAYRLDMVAVCGRKTVAIECDGEQWHSGEGKIREDMERQIILERLGWRFIRIRGSEFYRYKEKTINRVIQELIKFGIEPESEQKINNETETELLLRVKKRAGILLQKMHFDNVEGDYTKTISSALNPKLLINKSEGLFESESDFGNKDVKQISTKQIRKSDDEFLDDIGFDDDINSNSKNNHKSNYNFYAKKRFEYSHKKPATKSTGSIQQDLLESVKTSKPENDVIKMLRRSNIKYIDKRPVGGLLWIVGGYELKPFVDQCRKIGVYFKYAKNGGKQTGHKPAWWAK